MEVIGSGSIVQRDKTKPRSRCRVWQLQAVVVNDGRKCRRSKTYHGTYTQAQAALVEFVDSLRGTPITSDMAFSDWVAEWSRRREESGAYAKRTLSTDREKLAVALETWSDRPICDITPEDVRTLYQCALAGKQPLKRKWSAGTVARLHISLRKLFKDAVKEGLLAKSPVDDVKPPKAESVTGQALSIAQMDTLLETLDLTQAPHRAIALALGCGLRRSECCGLVWGDIRNGSVHVVRSCDDTGEFKAPKTASGVRSVPVPAQLLERLESVRESNTARVVDMLPRSLSRWWQRNREALGYPETRFHDLRHSYATRLAASGVHVRVAMQLCGWSSAEIAMKVYTHVSDSLALDAVSVAFGAATVQQSSEAKEKGQTQNNV